MFLKLSKRCLQDIYNKYQKVWMNDELILKTTKRERFVIAENSSFSYIYEKRNDANSGIIDKILAR